MGCLVAAAVLLVLIPALFVILGGAALTSTGRPGTLPPGPATQPPRTPTPEQPSPQPPSPVPPTPEPPTPPAPEPAAIPDRQFPSLPAPHSDEPAWVTVQQARLYTAEFPDLTNCPAPALFSTMAELEPYAAAELQCIQDAWRPVLAGLGLPSEEIPHFYYEGSQATSACGTVEAPAFYCSADGGAIYVGENLLRDTSWDPIWAKDLLGHEYGHHLQAVSGFFDAMYELPPGNETVRRNEIQATCMGLGMIRRDDSIDIDATFYDSLEPHLRSFLDDDIHGSPDSLAYWGMRGFHGDVVGECNTWVAGPEWVE